MIPQNQITFAATKLLLCALTLCICLFTAGFVITRVQASGASGTGEHVMAQQIANAPLTSGVEDTGALPSNETRDVDEEEAPSSDPPGSADQHNSTGDDVVIRIPR